MKMKICNTHTSCAFTLLVWSGQDVIKGREKGRNGMNNSSIKFQGHLLEYIDLGLIKKKIPKTPTRKKKVITQIYLSEFYFILQNFSLLYTHETVLHF